MIQAVDWRGDADRWKAKALTFQTILAALLLHDEGRQLVTTMENLEAAEALSWNLFVQENPENGTVTFSMEDMDEEEE